MRDFVGTLFCELLRGICTNGREKKYLAHGPRISISKAPCYNPQTKPSPSLISIFLRMCPSTPSKVLPLIINHDNFFLKIIFLISTTGNYTVLHVHLLLFWFWVHYIILFEHILFGFSFLLLPSKFYLFIFFYYRIHSWRGALLLGSRGGCIIAWSKDH